MNYFSYEVDTGTGRPSRARRTMFASLGLAYLFYPLGDLTRHGGWAAVPRAAALIVFIVAYVGIVWTSGPWTEAPRRLTWVLLAVLTALCVAGPAFFGGDWAGLFIYLTIIVALTVPMRWVLRGVGAATALGVVEALLLGADRTGLLTIGITAGTLGLFMAAFRNARMLNVELQRARAEVARLAATEERLRIARDLHDLLGHSLSLIVLKAEVARRLGDKDVDRALGEVADIESVARQALTDVRSAVSGFRQRNLTEELDSARAVLTAAGITPVIKTSGTPLPDVTDGLLGWAVREGITNVVRHARATRCEISIRRTDSAAVLEILDNGVAGPDFQPGNGLTGLTERIQESGGTTVAAPRPEGGFRLEVSAPLSPVPVESPA